MNHRNCLIIGVILLVIMPVVCMVSSVWAQGLAGESIWTFDGEWPTKHIETADLNGDGTFDVIAGEYNSTYYTYPHQVVAADGKTGDTIWIFDLPAGCRSMTIGDINNDGVMDIIAGTSGGDVYAINGV
ncbi:MAG: VCBS repeat-containing protein, partial [candidate division Zixibacteria bacterium]|nr:VCBS repeat-containing protein [candidate division Zixibacteria bacterium]